MFPGDGGPHELGPLVVNVFLEEEDILIIEDPQELALLVGEVTLVKVVPMGPPGPPNGGPPGPPGAQGSL